MADQPHLDEALHLPPSAHVLGMDVGPRAGVARVHIAPRGMVVREGPVDQVHVQSVQPQVVQAAPASRQDLLVAMAVVPELRGDEHLVAGHPSPLYGLQRGADVRLIAVDGGAVEVPVADLCGGQHPLRDGVGVVVVGTERPQPNGRHPGARRQSAVGDALRVHAIGRKGKLEGMIEHKATP